jgi:manganese efflux pump family protein
MVRLLAVAAPLGLSNFAGGLAIGLDGLAARRRLEAALVFAAFEAAMPVAGLALGRGVATLVGDSAAVLGGLVLVGLGAWLLLQAARATRGTRPRRTWNRGRLVVVAAGLSVDNLVAGFALGALHVSVLVAALVIGAVSAVLGSAGLELGHRAGRRLSGYADACSAAGLIAVGALAALRIL